MNETRFEILRVAFTLFLQKSFKEVTMREIVEKTGFSKGAFYHYFTSKEQLYREAIEMFCITLPFKNNKLTIREDTLYNFYHDYVAYGSRTFKIIEEYMKEAKPEGNINLITMGFDAMRRLPEYRAKNLIINAEVHKLWVKVIKSARGKGEISSVMSDEQIAYCFMYINEGMGLRYAFEGRSADCDKDLLTLWDAFYEQIKKKGK